MPVSTHPCLTLEQAKQSYFIHDDQAFSVASAPAGIFKAAILVSIDPKKLRALAWAPSDVQGVLRGEMDIFCRWWLLVTLRSAGCPLRVYGDLGVAEQAVRTTC